MVRNGWYGIKNDLALVLRPCIKQDPEVPNKQSFFFWGGGVLGCWMVATNALGSAAEILANAVVCIYSGHVL